MIFSIRAFKKIIVMFKKKKENYCVYIFLSRYNYDHSIVKNLISFTGNKPHRSDLTLLRDGRRWTSARTSGIIPSGFG